MHHYYIYCKKLYFLLKEIITKSKAEGLLLSGGLDSSIIASIQKPKFTFTVTLEGHNSDKKYAKLIAEKYGSTHITITINYNELIEIEKKVIELFKTFDPIFIRNSSVIFAALQQASEMEIDHVLTGDGSDELFAGYNYLRRYYLNKKELEFQVKRLWDIMSFPSQIIGNFFNIRVSSPYLDEKFLEFAKSLDISLKVNKYQNKIWGKFILRKCFQRWENLENFAWRTKEAQEEGSGFSNITSYFENHGFSNKEYLNNIRRIKETENVNIRNKEHLFYYLYFRKHFLPPKLQRDSIHNKICPDCNCSFKWSGQFCKICGAYPVEPLNNQE